MNEKLLANDLLNNFDIKKYDVCKEWGADQWLIALSKRSELRYFLRSLKGKISDSPMPREVMKGQRKHFLTVAEERLKNPIEDGKVAIRTTVPVVLRDFLISDLDTASEIIEWLDPSQLRGISLQSIAKANLKPQSMVYVAVNLEAPDTIIQEKFSNWLKKTRSRSGISPKHSDLTFKDNDFSIWHSQRLLPFLDLVFWAKLSGTEITQAEIAAKLFPGFDDPMGRMRSIVKNAMTLINRECVEALSRQSQAY